MRRIVELALLLAAWSAGCHPRAEPADGGAASSTTGGAAASGSTSTSSSSSSSTGTGGAVADEPCPSWEGWAKWDDFAASYPFCYAKDPEHDVEPIIWEPCDPLSGMTTGCRQMKVTWPWEFSAFGFGGSVFRQEDGTIMLSFSRVNSSNQSPRFVMPLVAEADGPVRAALLDPRVDVVDYAWIQSPSLRGGGGDRAMFRLAPINPELSLAEAMVGFKLDNSRPFLEHIFPNSTGHGFAASGSIWGTWDSYRILIAHWGEEPKEVWGPAQSGYQQTQVSTLGEFAVWSDGDELINNIDAWTPQRGAYPFISFGDDDTHGAEVLGMDGVDMVWIESEGRLPDGHYAERSFMTSPFTTDPAELAPRRLRSFPSPYALTVPITVGCGYAGYGYEPGKVLLIRLEDGYWWELPTSGCTGPDFTGDFCFEEVYLITCEEMFLRGGMPMNIARVDIASLGDPNPPD